MSRRAFTLPDMVVLSGILLLLVGLFTPAINQVREDAKANQCKENLRKLAAGVLKYHDQHKRFPTGGTDYLMGPSYDDKGVPLLAPQQTAGWLFQILPFIGEKGLYEQTDLSDNNRMNLPSPPWPAGSYRTHLQPGNNEGLVRTTPVEMFFCPSRREVMFVNKPGFGTKPVGLNDYVATHPDPNPPNMTDPEPHFKNIAREFFGIIVRNWEDNQGGQVRINDDSRCTHEVLKKGDGAAHTLMLSEKFLPTNWYNGGHDSDDGGPFTGWDFDTIRSTVHNPAYFPNPSLDRPVPHPSRDSHRCQFVLGSAHPKGIHAAFGDGSVRVIRYGIDAEVLHSLGHRSDGKKVDLNTIEP